MRLLTLARDLQRRRARERHQLFVCEGIRATEELLRSPLPVRGALASAQLAATPRGAALRAAIVARGIPLLDVADGELADAADTDSPQGILAIAEIPRRSLEGVRLPPRPRLVILDAIQDPGNVGTILRTAAAFGAAATLALPGTVDLWNAKVVRGAMGAHFHHPALSSTWESLDAFLSADAMTVWAADGRGEPLPTLAPPDRLALVVGNEGSGLTDAARARATRLAAIPIVAGVESLNVAVAAGILLYHVRP